MAKSLTLFGAITAGSTSASMSFIAPGQDTITAKKTDEYAIEYDLRVNSINRGWNSVAFALHDEMSSPWTSPYVDQEGRNQDTTSAVDDLFLRMQAGWYHRVIPCGRAGLPGSTLIENFRIGLWLTHPTGTPPTSNLTFQIANVRLTNFRETVLWIWRENMAVPTFDATSSITSPSCVVSDIAQPELPAYCSNGKLELLDDLQSRRYAGGALNTSISWDSTKRAFTLSNIRLTAENWWDLMTFYDLFRRDAIVYRHQANLPAMLCRFVRPPSHDETIEAGKVVYNVQLVLQQR